MISFRTRLLPLLALFALTACNSNYDKIPPVPTNIVPMAPAAGSLTPYRVQIGDVLDLKFRLNPELNETVTVRPDGMISTAYVEDLSVYNLTVSNVNDALKGFYKKELKDPQVSVIVHSFAPTRVYVSGEVYSPGEFVVIGPTLTLTQALARAGGIKNSADAEHMLIIRRGAGEKNEIYRADYDAATQGGDPAQDVRLAPYDVVFVPKTGTAMTYDAYQQYIQQYVQPSVGVNATYYLNDSRSR